MNGRTKLPDASPTVVPSNAPTADTSVFPTTFPSRMPSKSPYSSESDASTLSGMVVLPTQHPSLTLVSNENRDGSKNTATIAVIIVVVVILFGAAGGNYAYCKLVISKNKNSWSGEVAYENPAFKYVTFFR